MLPIKIPIHVHNVYTRELWDAERYKEVKYSDYDTKFITLYNVDVVTHIVDMDDTTDIAGQIFIGGETFTSPLSEDEINSLINDPSPRVMYKGKNKIQNF